MNSCCNYVLHFVCPLVAKIYSDIWNSFSLGRKPFTRNHAKCWSQQTNTSATSPATTLTGQIIVKRILTWAHVKPCEKNTNEEDFKVKDFSTQHLSLTPLFDILCQKEYVRASAIGVIAPIDFQKYQIAPVDFSSIFRKKENWTAPVI